MHCKVLRKVPAACSRTSRSSTEKKAANVFPVPVGDAMSTSAPARMSGHASFCAGVGRPYFSRNQVETRDSFAAAALFAPAAPVRALVAGAGGASEGMDQWATKAGKRQASAGFRDFPFAAPPFYF